MPLTPQDQDIDKSSFVWDDHAKHSFYEHFPFSFRRASEKLEFAEIAGSHLRFGSTPLGKQIFLEEFVPLQKTAEIQTSLLEIDELRTLLGAGETPGFGGIHDIRSLLHKIEIEGSTIYLDEGLPLLETIKTMRILRDFFAKRAKDTQTIWKTAVHLFDDRLVEMAVDSVFDENGAIKDSASGELREIRRDIIVTAERLRNKLNSLMRKYSEDDLLQEEIITQRDGRAVVPVKAEHKRHIAGMIHSVSQTGQTIYIEPAETIELNNELRSLEFAEAREIDKILRTLTERLRESVPALLRSMKAAGHIEAVYMKARYAMHISASSPNIKNFPKPQEMALVIREARHPFLIEKIGMKNTIPFDLAMDVDKRTFILTGPNAGGKTVLLKSVGIIALMALCGIPVPATPDSIIPVFDSLAVDIGDAQSIADDLSTFSSHVNTLRGIVEQSNEYTLTLLDEVGSGTAPEEGGALAESILEYLTKQAGFTIATTHYGRLAAFAETYEGAINGSMEFSDADLRPTYRFRMGIPGSSHAFDIAERYKLPSKIIAHARSLAGSKSSRLEELIDSLNRKEQELMQKKAETEKELGKARIERMDFERQNNELNLHKKEILSKASNEADTLLSGVNTYIEKAIREAREAAAPPKKDEPKKPDLSILRAKQKEELKDLQAKVDEHKVTTNKEEIDDEIPFSVGVKVRLLTNPDRIGDIITLKGNEAEVAFGSVTMRVKTDKLQSVSKKESRKEERSTLRTTTYFDEQFSPRIDLRGLYGDEGVLQVEKFLSDAIARGLDKVELIHGMGTGALGRRIQQELKKHPSVKSFRYGEPNEGGAGVTVVELK